MNVTEAAQWYPRTWARITKRAGEIGRNLDSDMIPVTAVIHYPHLVGAFIATVNERSRLILVRQTQLEMAT